METWYGLSQELTEGQVKELIAIHQERASSGVGQPAKDKGDCLILAITQAASRVAYALVNELVTSTAYRPGSLELRLLGCEDELDALKGRSGEI
jgi:hypothetical protein